MKIPLLFTGLLALVALLPVAQPAHAGLFGMQGVRSNSVSVCFVGNAVTARPARVAQIRQYIAHFERTANIRFVYWGTCPSSIPQPNGNDWFDGDIRIVIPNTDVNALGMVPGQGCPMFGGAGNYNGDNDGWGSWSNFPNDLAPHRPCLYNMKLGDDPWNSTPYLNHTLHEFGHALGLAHEHQRTNATCPGPGTIANGWLTGYDIDSVMHYAFSACGVQGNYALTGLSALDSLSVRMLYPEDGRPAQIVGTTLVAVGSPILLQFGWRHDGAYMPFVANSMQWRINGSLHSTAVDFQHAFAVAGDYTVALTVVDFLNRTHTGQTLVRVRTPQQIQALTEATNAIHQHLLLGPEWSIFYDGFDGN